MFSWITAVFDIRASVNALRNEVCTMATQIADLGPELAAIATQLEEARAEQTAHIQALNDEIVMLVEQLGQGTADLSPEQDEQLLRVKTLSQELADANPPIEPPVEPVV